MKARYFYVQAVLGGIAVVVAGLATKSPWWIFCGCAGPLLAIASVSRNRRRSTRAQAPAWEPMHGARVITPSALPPHTPQGLRWTGGCNVPGEMGRITASFPLSRLTAGPGRAQIEMRPRFIQRLLGYRPYTFEPNADTTVFPARGPLRSPAVAFQVTGQAPWYFGTRQQQAILTALDEWGFTVKWEEVRAKMR